MASTFIATSTSNDSRDAIRNARAIQRLDEPQACQPFSADGGRVESVTTERGNMGIYEERRLIGG